MTESGSQEAENAYPRAEEHVIPSTQLAGVCFPGAVENMEKATEMIKSTSGLDVALFGDTSESSLRVDLSASGPSIQLSPSSSQFLLLKVDKNWDAVSADVLGVVAPVYYPEAASYVVPTYDTEEMKRKIEEAADPLYPNGEDEESNPIWVEFAGIPGTLVESTPGSKLKVVAEEPSMFFNARQTLEKEEIHRNLGVSFGANTVPGELDLMDTHNEDLIELDSLSLIYKLQESFKKRFIWSARSIRSAIFDETVSVGILKSILPLIAYSFRSGPWKGLWVRRGFDPRTNPDSRYSQVIDTGVSLIPSVQLCDVQFSKTMELVHSSQYLDEPSEKYGWFNKDDFEGIRKSVKEFYRKNEPNPRGVSAAASKQGKLRS